ncbi:MAG: hypothetical protein OSJ58_18790, partial [Dysosmobacter sp.]|nr:hypothetical protein [Dysosmobacter sp.]
EEYSIHEYELSNHLNSCFNSYAPVCAFQTGAFLLLGRDIIADLKNPDKDCSYTPDSLLAELDSFIEKFHREFAWYSDPFCAAAFPDISQVQFDYLQKRFGTISTAIHDLLKQMKRSMKK